MRASLVLATLRGSGAASAATYPVAPEGDDAADGSEGAPWATLQHAADVVGPGDEVLVADGSYAGFALEASGDQGSPIAFRAVGEGAVIDAPGPEEDTGIYLCATSWVLIEGLHVVDMPGRGIAHRCATADEPSQGIYLLGNRVERSGLEGVYLSQAAASLVEGNVIRDPGTTGDVRSHGLYLANAGSDRTTIRGNDISGANADESNGIHANGDLSVGGDGLIQSLVIEGNVLHDNAQNGINLDGVQGSIVRNNVIYGNGLNGIRAYAIDGAEGPALLDIANNTILVPAGSGWDVRITEDQGGIAVFNNILLNDDDFGGSIALDDTQGFASATNLVADRFTPDRDDTLLDLAGWQALGYDTGSRLATAPELFVDPPGFDLHLLAGAPAVDTGSPSLADRPAPTTDFDGTARPVGAGHDIGAFEWCEGASCGAGGDGDADADADTDADADADTDADADADADADSDADTDTDGDHDGGCGCRFAGDRASGVGATGAAVLLMLLACRRRQVARRSLGSPPG